MSMPAPAPTPADQPAEPSAPADVDVARLKITFFCGSVLGYTADPAALPTRGLAQALAERGHIVRLTEQRMNPAFAQTLREVGSGAVRTVHDTFPLLQMHTWEPRRGAPLLEWLTRELALIDVAVVVAGAEAELVQWAAYVERRGLLRFYLDWDGTTLGTADAEALHLASFDHVLTPVRVDGVSSAPLQPVLAPQDAAAGLQLTPTQATHAGDAATTALAFERLVASLFRPPQLSTDQVGPDTTQRTAPTNGVHPPQ